MTNIKEFIAEAGYQEILKTLININSCNGNEKEVVNSILKMLPADYTNYQVIDHGSGRASLILNIKGKTSGGGIALAGHIDTVPAGDEDKWSYPPFEGVIDGEYMYGRGTADMKSGVTAIIVTALYFIKNNIIPANNLYFCFTADEEAGGTGICSMRDGGYLSEVKEIIIAEPSESRIGITEKGTLWLKFQAYGKISHASRPDKGLNAAEQMLEFIESVKSAVLIDEEPDPLVGKTTAIVTRIQSGIATNVVPDYALAMMDIRTIVGRDHEDIIILAEKLAAVKMEENPGLQLTVEVDNNRTAVGVSPKIPMVKNLQKLLYEMGLDTSLKGLYFYTDASQVIPQLNIPFVILGPGDDAIAHKTDERVKLSSIADVAEVYIRYILNGEG